MGGGQIDRKKKEKRKRKKNGIRKRSKYREKKVK